MKEKMTGIYFLEIQKACKDVGLKGVVKVSSRCKVCGKEIKAIPIKFYEKIKKHSKTHKKIIKCQSSRYFLDVKRRIFCQLNKGHPDKHEKREGRHYFYWSD